VAAGKKEFIAYCGLYCKECPGYKGVIADLIFWDFLSNPAAKGLVEKEAARPPARLEHVVKKRG
jgi:hypothetical protein